MKLAYLDCASGISGDMMLGALVDAGVAIGELDAAIQSLGLPGCRLAATEVQEERFSGDPGEGSVRTRVRRTGTCSTSSP